MSKLVSLSNETYSTLRRMKGKNRSFSEVIMELVSKAEPKRDFLSLVGSLKSESKELESLKEEVERGRKRNSDRHL